ncbi:MAG: hypothetical protein V1725_02135 [archaeon]
MNYQGIRNNMRDWVYDHYRCMHYALDTAAIVGGGLLMYTGQQSDSFIIGEIMVGVGLADLVSTLFAARQYL